MLNKIVKLVGLGTIIGLNGLSAWGSDDYEIWDGNGPMPTENIMIEYDETGKIQKIVILNLKEKPEENPIIVYEEDESKENYGEPIGLKLNLPEELIADCEDEYWKIHDDNLKQELKEIIATEESFHAWCNKQKEIDYDYYMTLGNFYRSYAYILKIANERNYLIPGDFCKRMELHSILYNICRKNYLCFHFSYYNSPQEQYLSYLKWEIKDML